MGQINKVSNGNVYIDGNNLIGTVKEMQLPEGAAKMVEHSVLGMQGVIDLPSGFEKMEAKITWGSFYADALAFTGDIYKFLNIQVRANLQQFDAKGLSTEKALVISMIGSSKNLPLGNFKANENSELETNFNVSYFKLTIGGVDVFEVDLVNNIYKVKGVDKLANYRANIGQ